MTFDVGQEVWVFNQSFSGTFVVEGQAKVVVAIDRTADRFLVDFGDGCGPVERFLDAEGQHDPQAHAEMLNNPGWEV
ncbi:MAG: hypothetical protein AAFX78_02605 [Cyanobacteria bacterium J06638_20]